MLLRVKNVQRLLMIAALLLLIVPATRAQEYAAVLRIVRPGVEIRRLNTEQWFALPIDAELPFGAGDVLRTDGEGRAWLEFNADMRFLILPDTTLELNAFDPTHFAARIDGDSLQFVGANTDFTEFALEAGALTVTQPAEMFGVWARADSSVLTVAQGDAFAHANNEDFTVPAASGLRVNASGEVEAAEMESPFSAARLIGQLDGCPGVTQTVGELNVNVRVGPGFSFTVIGSIENGHEVRVMGINAAGTWYRIQAFSGFGWMQVPLVENTCTDLPVLPNNTIERNIGVWQVTQAELELLLPFYGAPEDDLWFYRSVVGEG